MVSHRINYILVLHCRICVLCACSGMRNALKVNKKRWTMIVYDMHASANISGTAVSSRKIFIFSIFHK